MNKLNEMDELLSKYLQEFPDDFYEKLLLGPLTNIYKAKKMTDLSHWMDFSNLLIDKFAIHSLSFYHLNQGIVERKIDSTIEVAKGYDLFSINALFRVMMETYIAFNWIFVNPKTSEEKEFRYLLWKLDGLFEMRKFGHSEKIKLAYTEKFAADLVEKEETIQLIMCNDFYKLLPGNEVAKVLDIAKNKSLWKYELKDNYILRPLKITELIEITCRMDAFLNMYRYSSLYSHSNYISVEKFRKMRGKLVSDEYAEPLIRLAIYLTILLIDDMCIIDTNAAKAFAEQEPYFQRFITTMSRQIKQIPICIIK